MDPRDLSAKHHVRRIGQTPSNVVVDTASGMRKELKIDVNAPQLVLTSDFANAPFVRGNIVYQGVVDSTCTHPERPGHAFIAQDGSVNVRFPKWRNGDDVISLENLLKSTQGLGIRAELHGTAVRFYRGDSALDNGSAIAQLLDAYFCERVPSELQRSPSRLSEARSNKREDSPAVILCANRIDLAERISGFIPANSVLPWHVDWRNDLLKWDSARGNFDLDAGHFLLIARQHNGRFSLTVRGRDETWSNLEKICGPISEHERSTYTVEGKLVPELTASRLSVVDFKAALERSPYDWDLAAKVAARDELDNSQKVLMSGERGLYTVHFYIGHDGKNQFTGHRWRHSDGKVAFSSGDPTARSYLGVSVAQLGGAGGIPAGSYEMIQEMKGIRDDVIKRFLNSHGEAPNLALSSLPKH